MQSLLRSRKFYLSLWALIQTIVGHYLQIPSDIIAAADAVVIVLVAAIAYEDGQEKSGNHYHIGSGGDSEAPVQ